VLVVGPVVDMIVLLAELTLETVVGIVVVLLIAALVIVRCTVRAAEVSARSIVVSELVIVEGVATAVVGSTSCELAPDTNAEELNTCRASCSAYSTCSIRMLAHRTDVASMLTTYRMRGHKDKIRRYGDEEVTAQHFQNTLSANCTVKLG